MADAVDLSIAQSAHNPDHLTLSLTAGGITLRKEIDSPRGWRVAHTIGAWYGWIVLNTSDKTMVATDEEVATDLTKGQHDG